MSDLKETLDRVVGWQLKCFGLVGNGMLRQGTITDLSMSSQELGTIDFVFSFSALYRKRNGEREWTKVPEKTLVIAHLTRDEVEKLLGNHKVKIESMSVELHLIPPFAPGWDNFPR